MEENRKKKTSVLCLFDDELEWQQCLLVEIVIPLLYSLLINETNATSTPRITFIIRQTLHGFLDMHDYL